jgi:hypothetical protein
MSVLERRAEVIMGSPDELRVGERVLEAVVTNPATVTMLASGREASSPHDLDLLSDQMGPEGKTRVMRALGPHHVALSGEPRLDLRRRSMRKFQRSALRIARPPLSSMPSMPPAAGLGVWWSPAAGGSLR